MLQVLALYILDKKYCKWLVFTHTLKCIIVHLSVCVTTALRERVEDFQKQKED